MRVGRLFILIFAIITIDQLIKTYIISGHQNFDFTTYQNVGISFALLPILPWRSILPFVLFGLIGVMLHRQSYGLSFIIAGGISNLIDRAVRGGVVDFIDLKIVPVFNMADLFISMGCIILLIELIKQELKG